VKFKEISGEFWFWLFGILRILAACTAQERVDLIFLLVITFFEEVYLAWR